MEKAKIHISKTPKYTIEFIEWINGIADKINSIIENSNMPNDFKKEHLINFNLDESFGENLEEKLYSNHNEIGSDFLYAIPNMMAYIIQKSPKYSKKIVLSLGKYYQYITGNKIDEIDWFNIKNIPKSFTESAKDKKLSNDFEKYMFGRIGVNNFENHGKPAKYHFEDYLLRSSIFRKLYGNNLQKLDNLKKAEFIRYLVNNSLENISDIEAVSDEQWIDFLEKGASKALDKKKKLLTRYKNLSSKKMITQKGKLEKDMLEIEKFLKKIKTINKNNDYDDNKEHLPIQANCSENSEKLKRLKELKDYMTLDLFEDQIFSNIIQSISRLHINISDDYNKNGIPKNFLESKEFSCFSGVWIIASLLLKSGIKKENIFLMDLGVGENDLIQKHTALLIKKTSGDYIKLDYGNNLIEKIKPSLSKDVDYILKNIDLGMEETPFNEYDNNNGEYMNKFKYIYGLGRIGALLRLDDGISLFYLISLAGTYLDDKKYDKMLEILNIAKSIDRYNYNVYELLGIANYNLGDEVKAIENFKKVRRYFPYSPYSLYFLGEIYFKRGEYVESKKFLNFFISNAGFTWGLDKSYIFKAEEFMNKINDKEEKKIEKSVNNKEELKIDDLIKKFDLSGIDYIEKEYFKLDIKKRAKILEKIKKIINKGSDKKIYWKVIYLTRLLEIEKEKNTKIGNKSVIKIDF